MVASRLFCWRCTVCAGWDTIHSMSTPKQRLQLIVCAAWLFLDEPVESPMLRALSRIPYNHAADILDGTRRTRTSTPHNRRWWERTARDLSSDQFTNAFRMRYVCFTFPVPYTSQAVQRHAPSATCDIVLLYAYPMLP